MALQQHGHQSCLSSTEVTIVSANDLVPTRTNVLSALAIACASVLIGGIYPVFIGALLSEGRLSLDKVGLFVMTELLALVVGIFIASLYVRLNRVRTASILASLAGLLTNLLCLTAPTELSIIALRGATGLSEGILVWIATAVVVRASNPTPYFAVSVFLQLLSQAAAAAALSVFTIPVYGSQSVFVALAALCGLSMLLSLLIPQALESLPGNGSHGFIWRPQHFKPLAIAFLQVAAISAFWAYLEPLGESVGYDAQGIRSLVSATLLVGVVGASLSMITVQRFRPGITVFVASLGMMIIGTAMFATHAGDLYRFAVLLCAYQITCIFIVPFQSTLAIDVDRTGRVATVIPMAQLFGQAMGPFIASLAVHSDPAPALLTAIIMAAIATLLSVRLPRRVLVKA
ncbi:MFS transporter [Pseudomonas sp. B1-22]|uniref:MFS transporter n=1 Tax=Pseudomonas sp. B1-22 TaxID=3141456 RepID=UPI003D26D69E